MALAEIGIIGIGPAERAAGNRAVVSSVAELFWGVRSLQREWTAAPQHLELDMVPARRLAARIREFWDDGVGCFTEIFVLGARGGHLEDETPDAFLDALPALCRMPLERKMLTTEDPPDRTRVVARLNALRNDPRTRSAYVRLLETVWGTQQTAWRKGGRAAVRRAASSWQTQVDRGMSLPQAAFVSEAAGCSADVARMANEAAASRRLLAAPTYFGSAYCIVDAGPVTILSSPGERGASGGHGVRMAARAAASRYKALADPTRMAILALCRVQPLTIGEVARRLELAQPTVSAHFAALRSAELVREVEGIRPVRYMLNTARLDGILGEVRSLVLERGA